MTARRRRDGDAEVPGRVHGAWTTPAVVVRRPDGSIVGNDGGPGRVRPRRIPGAPGAVLLVPTLCEAGTGAEDRRLRRNSGTPATVSPLPPRVSTPDGGDDGGEAAPGSRPARPPLALVTAALRRGGRHARGTARVTRALQGIDLGRFVPDDPEARAERLAKLRRVGALGVATLVACLVIYTVFPVRTAVNLFEAEDRARERQAAFEREIAILEEEVADLRSDERIEVEARADGMVMPGEESYGIMPAPAPAPGASTSTTVPQSTSTATPSG